MGAAGHRDVRPAPPTLTPPSASPQTHVLRPQSSLLRHPQRTSKSSPPRGLSDPEPRILRLRRTRRQNPDPAPPPSLHFTTASRCRRVTSPRGAGWVGRGSEISPQLRIGQVCLPVPPHTTADWLVSGLVRPALPRASMLYKEPSSPRSQSSALEGPWICVLLQQCLDGTDPGTPTLASSRLTSLSNRSLRDHLLAAFGS